MTTGNQEENEYKKRRNDNWKSRKK